MQQFQAYLLVFGLIWSFSVLLHRLTDGRSGSVAGRADTKSASHGGRVRRVPHVATLIQLLLLSFVHVDPQFGRASLILIGEVHYSFDFFWRVLLLRIAIYERRVELKTCLLLDLAHIISHVRLLGRQWLRWRIQISKRDHVISLAIMLEKTLF